MSPELRQSFETAIAAVQSVKDELRQKADWDIMEKLAIIEGTLSGTMYGIDQWQREREN